jgi:hypothetical protein
MRVLLVSGASDFAADTWKTMLNGDLFHQCKKIFGAVSFSY